MAFEMFNPCRDPWPWGLGSLDTLELPFWAWDDSLRHLASEHFPLHFNEKNVEMMKEKDDNF